jgi:cytoskeleton protein RodZ
MSDDSDNQKESKIALGKELAKIRLEKKLSIKEIAREIRIEPSVIKKIEKNDFESIGAPVFVKGYLRQYASFIEMDADEVLEKYNQLNLKEDASPIINDSVQQLSKFIVTPKIIIFSISSIAISMILWFVFSYFTKQDKGFESNVITNNVELDLNQEPSNVTEAVAIEPELNESQDLTESITVIENQEPSNVTEAVAIEPVVVEERPSIALTMNYRGLCWAEVYDSDGNQIFYGFGDADNDVNVTGVGPLDVTLGAADELISIQVNEQDYSIIDPVRRGEVLRFQIEGL